MTEEFIKEWLNIVKHLKENGNKNMEYWDVGCDDLIDYLESQLEYLN